ncbi:unnamed protein product [Effrenium voratum]|uniref:Uncharacterized protein n=1 Tax=Effrenium voratum TaxID=2562239 RepID=A0AA36N292_9DINO|nr:unnamed protein product [Effrenium voratum]CAJ1389538.1 unnamed protein product [Effrenium voratum]CAJ1432138.1 unnamed protein product [Effrenium voratum]
MPVVSLAECESDAEASQSSLLPKDSSPVPANTRRWPSNPALAAIAAALAAVALALLCVQRFRASTFSGASGLAQLAAAPASAAGAFRDAKSFYMYRAQSDESYAFENVNAANLAGLMWYLEHEVVFPQCPRHYNITRILRYNVTVKTPHHFQHNFSRFFAFDKGMCTTPTCAEEYAKNGFTVGCQYQQSSDYQGAVWYSLPGKCPVTPLVGKNAACGAAMPGGRCDRVTGERNCTWSADFAGQLDIAELEGVSNWTHFCLHHGNEYVLPFWSGRGHKEHMQTRLRKVQKLFESKYPKLPSQLEEPLCDWRPRL